MKSLFAAGRAWCALALLLPSSSLALTVDNFDRESVRDFYNDVYLAPDAPINWTGDDDNCIEGTTSQAFKDDVLLRINYFRRMAGLAEVTFDAAYNARCQKAALIRSRYTGDESPHYPQPSWPCYTAEGAAGCAESILYQGYYGWTAVSEFMRDRGSPECGHRRWLLFPNNRKMGTGDIPDAGATPASAIQAWDSHNGEVPPPHGLGYTAWPPAGYVPYQVVYAYWSFGYYQADFSGATVTMTKNGSPIFVTLETPTASPGEETLVWRPEGHPDTYVWPNPGDDDVYAVQINNVLIGGSPRTFNYTVTVMDPAVAGAAPPAQPTGVHASNGTYTDSVLVEWNTQQDADYYQVWCNIQNTPEGALLVKDRDLDGQYSHAGALPEVIYYYFVRAGNADGLSPYSVGDEGWAARALEPPAAPTGVQASDGAYTDHVKVQWNPVGGATRHRVYRHTINDTGGATTVRTTGPNYDTIDDESAVPGTVYYYWVRAENEDGWGDYSTPNTGYAAVSDPAPEPPENVRATDGLFNHIVYVAWDAVEGATRYEVWRSELVTPDSADLLDGDVNGTAYQDWDAMLGTIYWYWIRATDGSKTSDWSRGDSGFMNVFRPAAPTVFASQGSFLDRILVLWLPTARTTGYEVWRSVQPNGEGATHVTNVPGSRIGFGDLNVVPGQTNYYFVRATNGVMQGNWSDATKGYTSWALLAPSNVVATDGAHADRVVVTWEAAPGVYSVWRSTNNSMAGATRIAYNEPTKSIADVGITPGRLYYYQVTVVDSGITSAFSAVDSGYAENNLPPPAPIVLASQGQYSSVFVSWVGLPVADHYDVARGETNNPALATIIENDTTQVVYYDNTAQIDRGYYYFVRAYNENGNGAWSAGAYGYVLGMTEALPVVDSVAWDADFGGPVLGLVNLSAGATNEIEVSTALGPGANWTSYAKIIPSEPECQYYDLGRWLGLNSYTGLFYRVRSRSK
ncbi:MAG: hypothetical protein KA248_11945 [Kiritimatiellae bacterium]|nr:hypothetical protein [Kiritimatiellia bacterium]